MRDGLLQLAVVAGGGALCLCVPVVPLAAAETEHLAPIHVLSDYSDAVGTEAEGSYRINRRDLDEFGAASGDFTSILGQLPNIQFSEDRRDPDRLHDLRPDSVSISGGRFYENAFRVDGLGINNQLDPVSDNPNAISDVPGHEQTLFIDADLIESIDVYDSNVPAAYGRFTGGVVDIDTRRAGREPETSLGYNTTRSDWVNYRVFTPESDDTEEGIPPTPPEPAEFKRERLTARHERPVGEASSIVVSGAGSRSSTPEVTLGESRAQTQENVNLLGKFSTPVTEATYADMQAAVAPFRSEQFITNARDSDFTIRGGGANASLGLDTVFDEGTELDTRLSARYSENSRRAPTDFFNWARTRSRNWGNLGGIATSNQGGFGDLDKEQFALGLSLRARTPTRELLGQRVRFDYGAEVQHSRLHFTRPETLFVYQDARVNPDVECRGRSEDCVDGEQYFRQRTRYPADDVSVGLTETAAFGEATFPVGALDLTLGLRYDYNDFLGNHDFGWRTRAGYDVFGNDHTVLIAGLNRYYSGALLTYRLREAREPWTREFRGATQNVVNDWERDTGAGQLRFEGRDVDTPYSDERTIGVRQRVLGGVASLNYVRRDNRDEFAQQEEDETRPDGTRARFLTNEGRSRYESFSFSWRRQWGRTTLGISATYSESESSNATFDDAVEEARQSEFVFYKGEPIRRSRLSVLRQDFNRPITGSVSIARTCMDRLRLSLVTRYRGRFTNVVETGSTETVTVDEGGIQRERELTVYAETEQPPTLISDLSVNYSVNLADRARLGLEAEVGNVFNSRTHTVASGRGGIETGRTFWLGANVTF
ncbi:TonB-dependent receptor plug domain-containing protein [Aquisalimonas asiatica]|uniref:Outer membrane receptor proteins, mostly Fe transport n=1 Tax=Aquisalimonas asiatica TaxID=406100 RepID=A0A1H8QUN1_9GAMM|nr:TonB-dependent receptor plug domain-containing protein [Aquisalimonas asiatica]SEO57757.1 Outer membrane receptor proteins, mostly Fe transport [Aquisalimonas asiatica]